MLLPLGTLILEVTKEYISTIEAAWLVWKWYKSVISKEMSHTAIRSGPAPARLVLHSRKTGSFSTSPIRADFRAMVPKQILRALVTD